MTVMPVMIAMSQQALADCALSDSTVACSGTDTDGFQAGTGVNNLNITVNSGGTVQANVATNPSVSIYVNAGNTITNNGTISNTGGSQTNNYLFNLNGSNNTLVNNGSLNMEIATADILASPGKNTRTLRGIYTSSNSGDYENINIVNNGSITLSHAGIGNAQGFYPGEDIDGLTIENNGTIAVSRINPLTISVSGGNVFATAGIAGTTAAALGVATAIGSDDDAEMTVVNSRKGVIEATGDYTAAIYARAVEFGLDNSGIVRSNSNGIAIATFGGKDTTQGETEIINRARGQIIGDILAVDGNALRYWGQEAKGLTGLTLNNQAAQVRNSELENMGTITGNIYLGSGIHEIENEARGTITGNISVNQAVTNTSAYLGNKTFTFENEGKFTGNVTVKTASSTGTALIPILDVDNNPILNDEGEPERAPVSGVTVNSQNHIYNSGTFTGNIQFVDVAGSHNTVTLVNDGFTGDISATTGAGTNVLNLDGSGTLRGDVLKFSQLNVGAGETSGGDDDDDDEAGSGAVNWTLASGKTYEFTSGARIVSGSLNVLGILHADTDIEENATLSGTGTIIGNVDSEGEVDVGSGTLHVTGNVEFDEGGVLKTTITKSGVGKLAVTGDLEFDDDASIKPVMQGAIARSGQVYTVASAASISGPLNVQSTALVDWTASNQSNELVLTASVKSASTVAGISRNQATMLDIATSFDSELGVKLQNLTSPAAVQRAAEQLRPEVNGASINSTMGVTSNIFGVISGRNADAQLAELAGGKRGIATGDASRATGIWFQALGFTGQQDRRKGVDGYDANTGGFAAGVDTLVGADQSVRVGGAFSYAMTRVDGDGTGGKNDINSYQGTLYASRLFDSWYLNGAVGIGRHDYDSKRSVLGGAVSGDYNAWQYTAKLDAGIPFQTSYATFIPVASLTYSYLDIDGYTEKGLGALKVGGENIESLRSGLGGKAIIPLSMGELETSLELRAIWNHEFGDDRFDTSARFSAGGASFKTSGVKQERDSANLGASIKLIGSRNQAIQQSLSLVYDAEIKDQYVGHTGLVQARFDF